MNAYGYEGIPEHRVKRMRTNTIAEITSANGVELWSTGLCKDAALSCDTVTPFGPTLSQHVDLNGVRIFSVSDVRQRQLHLSGSLSAAPAPDANVAVIWQDDGTVQKDGELMATVNNGSGTVTGALVPWEPIRAGTHVPVADIAFNGTTNVVVPDCILTLEPGTYWVSFSITLFHSGVTDDSIVLLIEDPSGVPADVTNSMVAAGNVANIRNPISGSLVMVVAATTTYQLGFRWATSAGTSTALDYQIGVGQTDPDSTATLVAMKIA